MTNDRVSWFNAKVVEYDQAMSDYLDKVEYDLPRMPTWIRTIVYYPFYGAYARVRFEVRGDKTIYISTYLDVMDHLAHMGAPYFEAYPIKGDIKRWLYDDQALMYPEIVKELRRQVRKKYKSLKVGLPA